MRLSGALVSCLLSTAALAGEVVVRPGETLAQVAKRHLGDERAAGELKALNNLTADQVAPGTTLRLPGPDRALALSALSAARNAVRQAGSSKQTRAAAATQLERAEVLFGQARYSDAAKAADEAWQQVSDRTGQPTQFAVEVKENGQTRVSARSGRPVRVEAQGAAQALYAGQAVEVDKGQPPGRPESLLAAPALKAPERDARLALRAMGEGFGPVRLLWEAVPGAREYQVRVEPSLGGATLQLAAPVPELKLPPLAPGRYAWTVRAVDQTGLASVSAQPLTFEVLAAPLKLEVEGGKWK